LATWSIANAAAVSSGWAAAPGPDLAVSFVGIAAVVTFSMLAVRSGWAEPLRYCGHHSICIYLAFTLFMGPARQLLLKAAFLPAEAVALLAMAASVLGSLALSRAVKRTAFGFLFERPEALRLPALSRRLGALHGGLAAHPSAGPRAGITS
jgi:hypothetical protein